MVEADTGSKTAGLVCDLWMISSSNHNVLKPNIGVLLLHFLLKEVNSNDSKQLSSRPKSCTKMTETKHGGSNTVLSWP